MIKNNNKTPKNGVIIHNTQNIFKQVFSWIYLFFFFITQGLSCN